MRRSFVQLCFILGSLVLASPGNTASNRDIRDCDQTKNTDLAIAACTRVINAGDDKSNTVAAYSNRGDAYDTKGEHAKAIADYDKALSLNPRDWTIYDSRGIAYFHKGDFDHAIADWSEVLKLNPKNAQVYINRGDLFEKKGNKEKAIEDYRMALSLKPSWQGAKDSLKRLGAE